MWSHSFIVDWKQKCAVECWVEGPDKKRKKLWRRRDRPAFSYPYKEVGNNAASSHADTSVVVDATHHGGSGSGVEEVQANADMPVARVTFPSHAPVQPPASPFVSSAAAQGMAAAGEADFGFKEDGMYVGSLCAWSECIVLPSCRRADTHAGSIPAQFKKFAGRRWADVLRDPKGVSYFEWVVDSMKGRARDTATAALTWARENGIAPQQ